MELVSVILPTYNRAHLLPKSMNSVLSQSWPRLELIVVDDKSTDNTAEVVAAVADDRVRYVKNDTKKKGANVARNIGITHAEGDFIAFQDSDDEWLPDKLSLQLDLMRRLGSDYACVYSRFVTRRGSRVFETVDAKRLTRGNILFELLNGNIVTTQTALVRKKNLLEFGCFDEELPRLQDWDLWLRMAQKYKFDYVDKCLVVQNVQDDSISMSGKKYTQALQILLGKYEKVYMAHNVRAYAKYHAALANALLRTGEGEGDLTSLYNKAIELDYFNWKFRLLKLMNTYFRETFVAILKMRETIRSHNRQ